MCFPVKECRESGRRMHPVAEFMLVKQLIGKFAV